jgi:DNA-binding IclR family transcriptional regulator
MNIKINEKTDRYAISSIEKALDVIEVLSEHESLNLLELAEVLDKPKSSLYRILLTLEKRDYVMRDEDDGKYTIGYKTLEMTRNLLERTSLRRCGVQDMHKLAEKYGDTLNLAVLTKDDILYIEILEGTHSLRMMESVGSKAPFHASAIGKAIVSNFSADEIERWIDTHGISKFTKKTIVEPAVLKSELVKIKRNGYAIDDEEVVQGARCVAAPIFNIFKQVVGAISISGAMHRFPDDQIQDIANDIKLAAMSISKKLGYIAT